MSTASSATNMTHVPHDGLTEEAAKSILQRMAGVGRPATAGHAVAILSEMGASQEQVGPVSGMASPLAESHRPAPVWNEETLRAVLESVPDAVIAADAGGAIVLVNRQTEDLFGYQRSELLGKHVELLMPERFQAKHVEQRARYFADPKIRPMGPDLELWGRHRDGHEFPVEISLSPMHSTTGPLVTTTIRDISRRRLADARYRTLVEGIPAVTFLAALHESASQISEKKLYVSPQIETLLGFTEKEWLDDPMLWEKQLHPDDRERWHTEFARTVSMAETFESEYRFFARDGRVVWVHGHAKVVRERDGRPWFLQGWAYDITHRKQAEEAGKQAEEAMSKLNQTLAAQVAEAVAEADERAKELARSNEALDAFAYIAAHDLREPLRTMIRYMQLLERQYAAALDDKAREYVAKAITGARQMNQLITDLHTHSRIGRQGAFVPVQCAAVVAEACGNLRAVLEENQAVVTTDDRLPSVQAVKSELVLLFQNLVQNAVRYRSDRVPTIHIGARREVDHWLLWVEDNGIGIETQYFEKIFEVGRRLHDRSIPGTGFGLANCQRIVEHHGGKIWVESKPGAGSKFLFTLQGV